MSDRWWVAALVYPAPLYVGLVVLAHFSNGGLAMPLGFALALAFGSATGFGALRHPIVVWVGRLLFVLAVLVPAAYGPAAGGLALDFAGGVLIGSPFLWLEYAWRTTALPGDRVVAIEATLTEGVAALAAVDATPTLGAGPGGWQLLQALIQVFQAQFNGLGAILNGAHVRSLPLETTLDPSFVGLAVLAVAAILASWIAPRTALDESLPWSWVFRREPPVPDPVTVEELGLRPGQRDALASRSLPDSPEALPVPGLVPLLMTALFVLAFLALALSAPTVALLALVVGTVAGVVVVAVALARRLTPLGGLSA